MRAAVIFDVDGVLLELTAAEEDIFFEALGVEGLSRDWNSYPIRNDREIIRHVLGGDGTAVEARYLSLLADAITTGRVRPRSILGAAELLARLDGHVTGIATANLLPAARLRLAAAGVTHDFSFAEGAEGGGPKSDILARLIAASGHPRQKLVYIGDNLNDLAAGSAHAGLFIGFSTDARQRQRLAEAGARHIAASHAEIWQILARHMP